MAATHLTYLYALRPAEFLGAPALSLQGSSIGSSKVSFRPNTWSKQFSRQLRPARCCLSNVDYSDVALRKMENLIVDRLLLHFADTVHMAPEKLVQTVPVPTLVSPKPRVILIAGPTAVGKSRLSIELANAMGGEIINSDLVQVYQGLDIGAAKTTQEERQGVPHHLMDMVPPTEDYSYQDFLVDSRAATQDILSWGRVPIVTGGSGMYMCLFMHNKLHLQFLYLPLDISLSEKD